MDIQSDDPARFRKVLGHYPTGVCVVTAMQSGNRPVGMTVGSFTSVSLKPPLVAFFPGKESESWPLIEPTGKLCVNVLASTQGELSGRFASKTGDKFQGLDFDLAGNGTPILRGVLAWIACDLFSVQEAGDHFIAVGQVRAMDLGEPGSPLLFFRGGYGHFSPLDAIAV